MGVLGRVLRTQIENELDLRNWVLGVTVLCVSVSLTVDVANQLYFFMDWPTAIRSWAITTALALGLAAPISWKIARTQLDVHRSNLVVAAVSATNEAIVEAGSPDELFERVCAATILAGEFSSAAIAIAEPGGERLTVRAVRGQAQSALNPLRIDLNPGPGQGLSTPAYLEGQLQVSNDIWTDPRCAMIRDDAQSYGVRSYIAAPLTRNGNTFGIMLISSAYRGTFTPPAAQLMARLANNVAFALDRFEQAEKKARAEAQLRWLAMHDPLTQLPNRSLFGQRLRAALERPRAAGERVAVLFIDLDRFKSVNDSLGHDCGDALLVETARRLAAEVARISRDDDERVARIGGDEFVAILPGVFEREALEARAREILAALSQPLSLQGVEYRPTASIGIAICPEDGVDEAALLKSADRAMYNAKDSGKNEVRFHVARTEVFETLALERMLQFAIERDEFQLHYQPKIRAATSEVTGLEALLRWNSPGMGLVSPQHFIPHAEDTGLIVEIGRWALRTAMSQAAAWRQSNLPDLPIAVNISPRQFQDAKLLTGIDDALTGNHLPGRMLQIEITEGVVMRNVDHAVDVLLEMRRRGVRVAIDDFGSGFSSMSMMKQLPVDTIKIDRSFVRDLPGGVQDAAIVKAIVRMARALGLQTIAEGVETEGQAQFLAECGCDELQGFLFSRAMPAHEVPAFVLGWKSAAEPHRPLPGLAAFGPAVASFEAAPERPS